MRGAGRNGELLHHLRVLAESNCGAATLTSRFSLHAAVQHRRHAHAGHLHASPVDVALRGEFVLLQQPDVCRRSLNRRHRKPAGPGGDVQRCDPQPLGALAGEAEGGVEDIHHPGGRRPASTKPGGSDVKPAGDAGAPPSRPRDADQEDPTRVPEGQPAAPADAGQAARSSGSARRTSDCGNRAEHPPPSPAREPTQAADSQQQNQAPSCHPTTVPAASGSASCHREDAADQVPPASNDPPKQPGVPRASILQTPDAGASSDTCPESRRASSSTATSEQ